MEAAARGDRYGSLLDAARRGGRGSSLHLHERLGDWWAELNQRESFVSRRQEARRADHEAEAAMEWEDWDGAGRDHDGGGRARADPASRKAMAALRVPAAGETREQGCAVCLEDFVTGGGGELRTMPCSHSFHRRCIFDWLLVNRRCPMCRFEMPPRTQDDSDDVRELVGE
ncbi:E3 ubiquitin-protein ligase RDUF1-like [Lolium perenne]|uniref:E3 ubiquitin-protein ligase RDUF1-like n=1 Tax=Lolium perenne TaxID=4522 RepID=UPI0021F5753C|nr:E3 ubiquitin-protein ligase RDUF1-like [Lolium perenne]